MATAYLLCRVADNIEDSGQPAIWQRQRFTEFQHLLGEPGAAPDVLRQWADQTWPGLSDAEVRMMGPEQGLPLWQIYAEIDPGNRASIGNWASVMAEGMATLDDSGTPPRMMYHDDLRVLVDESDYNAYCFYVAGTVGHMATEIVARHYGFSDTLTDFLSSSAEACGRSLQKTNIVKDFAGDVRRGVSYLPAAWLAQADFAPLRLQGAPPDWKREVIGDVLNELRTATEYLVALPLSARGYRTSSLLSLLPAYQTLLLAAKRRSTLFTDEHSVKISRPVMAKCVVDARAMLSDNNAIRRYGSRIEAEIDAVFGTA